jgi:hypothetical protein
MGARGIVQSSGRFRGGKTALLPVGVEIGANLGIDRDAVDRERGHGWGSVIELSRRARSRKSSCLSGGIGRVPQHELQDAAMAEILELVEGVDPAKERNRVDVPGGTMNAAGDITERLEAFGHA